MLTTTLNRIATQKPCAPGWKTLLKHLGKTQPDDEPLTYLTILESNGFEDALWCCRAEETKYAKEWRLYAVSCVRSVQQLMTDLRSLKVLDVAEAYAYGNASDEELRAAQAEARLASAAAWATSSISARATSARLAAAQALSAAKAARAASAVARVTSTAAWTAGASASVSVWIVSVAEVVRSATSTTEGAQTEEFKRAITQEHDDGRYSNGTCASA